MNKLQGNGVNVILIGCIALEYIIIGKRYTPPGRATQVAGATQVVRSTSIFFTKLWTYENI